MSKEFFQSAYQYADKHERELGHTVFHKGSKRYNEKERYWEIEDWFECSCGDNYHGSTRIIHEEVPNNLR